MSEQASNSSIEKGSQASTTEPWRLSFHGEGSQFFMIQAINFFLRLISFNFYYPWAKEKKLRYLYQQTEFAGSRFQFHGTGKEMFIGYLKLLGMVAIGLGLAGFLFMQSPILAFIVYVVVLFGAGPLAIHGTLKYRLSRSSWRGIFFSYWGKLQELFKKYALGLFLTMITAGIYSSWFEVNLRKYITENTQFGDSQMAYSGQGGDIFGIRVKYGVIFFLCFLLFSMLFAGLFGAFAQISNPSQLSPLVILQMLGFAVLALSIFVMMQRDLFKYHAVNTFIHQNGEWHGMNLNVSFSELLKFTLVNTLLTVFTFGIATPFVTVRTLQFLMPRLEVDGTFRPDQVKQEAGNTGDAAGEDLADFMDIDLA